MLLVAPVTSFADQDWAVRAPALYPYLESGVANLPRPASKAWTVQACVSLSRGQRPYPRQPRRPRRW